MFVEMRWNSPAVLTVSYLRLSKTLHFDWWFNWSIETLASKIMLAHTSHFNNNNADQSNFTQNTFEILISWGLNIWKWAMCNLQNIWSRVDGIFFSSVHEQSWSSVTKHHQLSDSVQLYIKKMIEFRLTYIDCIVFSFSLFRSLFPYVVVKALSICRFDGIKWSNIEFDWISKAHIYTQKPISNLLKSDWIVW